VVLIGAAVKPRGLDCGLCGLENCATAAKDGVACALSVNDLGIAVGSAAARAVGQGSAVVHALTHSLGLYFYAAAAIAYDRVGLDANDEVYA